MVYLYSKKRKSAEWTQGTSTEASDISFFKIIFFHFPGHPNHSQFSISFEFTLFINRLNIDIMHFAFDLRFEYIKNIGCSGQQPCEKHNFSSGSLSLRQVCIMWFQCDALFLNHRKSLIEFSQIVYYLS
uniref:Uncharacterized protein n=1 Tax=Trichogramma kaykai TaxID=54128 RepID=A0ABD2X7M1_9HYME